MTRQWKHLILDEQQIPKTPEELQEASQAILHQMDQVRNDPELNPFTRGTSLNIAAYELACLATYAGDPATAREWARQAFEHDAYSYEQHPFMVELALDIHQTKWETFAVRVATLNTYMKELHEHDGTAEAITELLRSHASRSPEVHALLEHNALYVDLDQSDQDDEALQRARTRLDHWKLAGVNSDLHDAELATILYYEDREDEVARLWQGRDLSSVSTPASFMRICVSLITHGPGLPEHLSLPANDNPVRWYNAATSVLSIINERLDGRDPGDLDEEEHRRWEQLVFLGQTCGRVALELFEKFEAGQANGSANWPHMYAMLCRNYGLLLEHTGDYRRSMPLYERGLELSPFLENAEGLVYAALQCSDGQKALSANEWIRQNVDLSDDFDSAHRVDRFGIWATALTGDLPRFLLALEEYRRKYHELYRVGRAGNTPDYWLYPDAFTPHTQQFSYGINNIWHGMEHLLSLNPHNPELISLMLDNRRYIANEPEGQWAQDFLPNLQYLRDPQNDVERERLFRVLSSAGYLVARLGTYQGDPAPLIRRGVALMQEAEQYLDPQRIGPHYLSQHHLELGRFLYLDLEENAAAEAHFTKAIDLLQDSPRLHPQIQENPDLLDKLPLKKWPDMILGMSLFYRAHVRVALGKPVEDSVQDLRESLSINPSNPEAWARLAHYIAGESPEANEEALQLAQRYLNYHDEEPDRAESGNILTLMVTLYADSGKTELAREKLQELETRFPRHERLSELKKRLQPRKKLFGLF